LSASEVRIQFRRHHTFCFAAQCKNHIDANALTLRLQPNEAFRCGFNGKVPA